MLPERIVRADRAARLLPGSADVRELAAREFPREDYLWVASLTRPIAAPRPRGAGFWGRLGRMFGTLREAETEAETASEPAPV